MGIKSGKIWAKFYRIFMFELIILAFEIPGHTFISLIILIIYYVFNFE